MIPRGNAGILVLCILGLSVWSFYKLIMKLLKGELVKKADVDEKGDLDYLWFALLALGFFVGLYSMRLVGGGLFSLVLFFDAVFISYLLAKWITSYK